MLKSQRSIDSYKRVIPDFPHGYKEWGGVFFFAIFVGGGCLGGADLFYGIKIMPDRGLGGVRNPDMQPPIKQVM